jgi:hypothetical protein
LLGPYLYVLIHFIKKHITSSKSLCRNCLKWLKEMIYVLFCTANSPEPDSVTTLQWIDWVMTLVVLGNIKANSDYIYRWNL